MRAKSPARRGSATRASSRGVDSGRVAAPPDVQVRELCNGRERARTFFGNKSPAPPPRTLPATGSAPQSGSLLGRCTAGVKEGLTRIFLPEGYPRSVSEDYLPYQVWDTLQAFCSTVTGMLASKAVLTGMGVGNEEATVSAALWQAVVRRNIGKVARIVFVTFKGADLDDNAKSWRIVADVLNDAALAIELVSPTLCPLSGDCNANWAFFAAVSMAEIFRSVVGVAGGASRAALTQHFALKDNFGDVSAKDGSQEVFVEILGSTMGMWIVGLCASSKATAWMAFGALTAMHILANVMACRAVCLNTFNRQRAQLVAAEWVKTGEVLTPQQAAGRESVVFFGGSGVRRMSITMGASLSNILSAKSVRGSSKNTRDRHSDSDGLVQDGALRAAFERASDWPFVVVEQGDAGGVAGGGSVMAGIREGATGREIVLCYFFAYLTAVQGVSASPLLQPDYDFLSELVDKCEARGWRLDTCHLGLTGTFLQW